MVSLIMILMRHPMDEKLYKEIRRHAGDLVMAYEMYMTFYEKSGYLDAVAVCGNTVVGYTSDSKADTAYLAEQSQKIIRKNGYKADVKIFMNERGDLGFGTGICDRNAAYNKALSGHSCQ